MFRSIISNIQTIFDKAFAYEVRQKVEKNWCVQRRKWLSGYRPIIKGTLLLARAHGKSPKVENQVSNVAKNRKCHVKYKTHNNDLNMIRTWKERNGLSTKWWGINESIGQTIINRTNQTDKSIRQEIKIGIEIILR